MSKWKLITTEQMDGRKVLITGRWDEALCMPEELAWHEPVIGRYDNGWHGWKASGQPTHWRPLPKFPKWKPEPESSLSWPPEP
jgi:hypothetical protein